MTPGSESWDKGVEHSGCGEASTRDPEGLRASSWAVSILILQTRWGGLLEDPHAPGAADVQCVCPQTPFDGSSRCAWGFAVDGQIGGRKKVPHPSLAPVCLVIP